MNNILIGIDGGATKISAHIVEINENKMFRLTEISAEEQYAAVPGFIPDFSPLDLQTQLQDYRAGEYHLTDDEIQQGAVYVETCARVIESLAEQTKCSEIIAGIGMPGLKTSDGKGIAVLANGPRMPQFIEELEERLSMGKIKFVRPIKRLGSDADYCGIGENYAENGLFRDVQNAYYIGLGTGAADALKINGKLLPFDKTKKWLAKTWEMQNSDGLSLESIVSAKGIQKLYAQFSDKSIEELDKNGFYADRIISLAENGDNAARECCRLFIDTLSELLLERITTLYAGWRDSFTFVNPAREAMQPEHPFIKSKLERIIIGQRIGALMKSESGKKILASPLLTLLKEKIAASPHLDQSAKNHYKEIEKIIAFSNLRTAPALGAAVDAIIPGDADA